MNKDLFKVPKANNRGSQESSVTSQSQKGAKFGRPDVNRFAGHDRRTVVTPKNRVHTKSISSLITILY